MDRLKLLKILPILFLSISLWSQVRTIEKLSDISVNISSFEGILLEMNLKLKYYDRVFEKIVFYDEDNVDIVFDVENKNTRKKLKEDLLNVHEGMLYRVKMKVNGIGNLGGIIADLIEFKPVINKIIP